MYYILKNTKISSLSWLLLLFCIFINEKVFSQTKKNTATINTTLKDSVPPLRSSIKLPTQAEIAAYDSAKKSKQTTINTVDTFNVNYSKDSLEAPINRTAIDSAIFLVTEKKFILYGKASTVYDDNTIEAEFIELDTKQEILFAKGLTDSSGAIAEQINMKMGDQSVTADSITYNTKTGKGLSHNSRTKNDELFIQSETTKLLGDRKSFYGYNNKFTTCNLDEPHFCFHTKKIKVINGELAVSNYAYPEFEGVPLPIGIPFGIYPMKKGQHSGLLPPQFTTNDDLGIGLEGLGYYKVLSPYWDVIVRTNIYSYGSWNLIVSPTYRKRYKYNGGFNLNIQNVKQNFKGDADFVKNRSFNFMWNHTADTRARPGVTFGASVNIQKSSFNTLNNFNVNRRINNQVGSSINWAKTFKQSNITIAANHSQNTLDNLVSVAFPTVTYSIQTLYPFAPKEGGTNNKWYEKIGIAYNGSLNTRYSFRDNQPIAKLLQALRDTFQWGANHNIPIQVALPTLGPIQVTPGISYEERTYGLKTERVWNGTTKKIDTTLRKGVYQARQLGFNLGIATALYGTYQFKKKGHGVEAIRHVIRPSIGIAYTPNMNARYYQMLQVDTTGFKVPVNVFENNLFTPFGNQRFGGINFGIDQNLEMKKRTRGDSTKEGLRKVMLIDGLSIGGGYNFLADSFQLSDVTISMRTTLANGKVSINGSTTLSPYAADNRNRKIQQLAFQNRKFGLGSFGRFLGANLAMSTQLSGGSKDKKNDKQKGKNKDYTSDQTLDMNMDEQQRMSEYINANPAEFVDFNTPWDLSLSVAITLSQLPRADYSLATQVTSNVNFNGNFALTPKWKVGGSGFYDFKTNTIQQITMFITREMHCWQLSINLVPVAPGGFRSFNITLNPKAGILRDLKVNRTRYFYGE